jgi:predicted lipoprotein with Yx(FWY)xxD motif
MKRWFGLLVIVAVLMMAGAVLAQDDDMMEATVQLGGNDELGAFLVDADGMTLYIFGIDEPGVSNCEGGCLDNWPPLTVAEGEIPTLADGISGQLGVINHEDGTRHVTYNGMPLYYWVRDAEPGDATGHLVNDIWFVATPPLIGLGGNDELGQFLVDADGMTLYIFGADESGVSNCEGGCADNWPPLTIDSEADLIVQPGLPAEFDVIERTDGSLQVTQDGLPLYGWIRDEAPGDSTGHLVNDIWFVAKLPTLAAVENEDFDDPILVGPNGMTLYIFGMDESGMSNCVDGCAINWPPLLIVDGEELLVGEGIEGEIATLEREDGSLQITYNDMPLYYWINDVVPGDTTGHEVRDVWFVAQP